MRFRLAAVCAIFLCGATIVTGQRFVPPRTDRIREWNALQKSIFLLESSARQWHAGCVSCHHQALEVITARAAKARGFKIDEPLLQFQKEFVAEAIGGSERKITEATQSSRLPIPQVGPNPAMVFGYSLLALSEAHVEPSHSTTSLVRYLALIRQPTGGWRCSVKQRPPFEASDFTATALMVKAERESTPFKESNALTTRLDLTRLWLNSAIPRNSEDLTFRLFGLHWAGSKRSDVARAARELLSQQKADGGWAQVKSSSSDAYATGEALVALRAANMIREDTPAFRKGIEFLLSTQARDGSWHVKSRALPIQKYFETGFPYGKDQFISYVATCWATLALLGDDARFAPLR